ncbi:MAG: apolipoprotein N-acyltransferase [Bacteroidota bacterium]
MASRGVRRTALIVALLATVGFGYWMSSRYAQNQLWGHLPLLLFLSAWAAVALVRSIRREPSRQELRWLGLASLSGLLLSLGFPPSPLTPLVFIGFIPLFMAVSEITDGQAPRAKQVLRYGFNAFILWNILTTFWVANTAFIAGVIAIVANSLLMCIPLILFYYTRRAFSGRFSYWPFVVYWITFEYLHMQWELTWPWLTLGNSFAQYPSWVQWYEYTGCFGGSLWILVVNVLGYQGWLKYRAEGAGALRKALLRPTLLLLLPLLGSLAIYFNYEEQGARREVVAVQPNFEPHYEKFEIPQPAQLQRFLKLSEAALTDSTDYLVFPETSFRRINQRSLGGNKAIRELQRFVNRYPRLKLVTGLSSYKIYEEGEAHSPAVREEVRSNGKTLYWESYNSAVQITSGDPEIPVYLKSKLVPGAEIFPYRRLLFFFKPLVDALGGALVLGRQPERSVFFDQQLSVAPIICYESVFGEYVTGYVRKGANALFIVTNDGWWDNTAGHRQHLQFARLRAVETRRSIARSANVGTCAFINQRGDVSQPTAYGEVGAIRETIQFNTQVTFYTRWQDMIARLALFTSILFLLNALAKGLGKRAGVKSKGESA